jgi:16S rRNA (uracil1498-N3)-methyltransferase
MANRFYVNCPLSTGELVLQGTEAHHLANVSRVGVGDRVCLFNGDGHQYQATVLAQSRRSTILRIDERESPARELPFDLHVAAPIPKSQRAQFLLEKLTEIGVTHFVPLSTQRSVVHPHKGKLEKLHRYVIEASKQCGRNVLMHVGDPMNWQTFCARADLPDARFLAHPASLEERIHATSDIALAVGPEGGFTDEEVRAGLTAGWRIAGLGPRLLRIETAAIWLAIRAIGSMG